MTLQAATIDTGTTTWVPVCRRKALRPGHGAAVRVGGVELALFRTLDDRFHAVQAVDPLSGARVVSRWIVGSFEGLPTVASPLYRQVFDLRSGRCLTPSARPFVRLQTYAVRLDGDVVTVCLD